MVLGDYGWFNLLEDYCCSRSNWQLIHTFSYNEEESKKLARGNDSLNLTGETMQYKNLHSEKIGVGNFFDYFSKISAKVHMNFTCS